MLELIDTKKYNIADYFIILSFNKPRSKQWAFIKNLIMTNFEFLEQDDVFFCFVKNELEQLKKTRFVLQKTQMWTGTFIFVKNILVSPAQIQWLDCYIRQLEQGRNENDKCLHEVKMGYTEEDFNIIYSDFPCNKYFGTWELEKLRNDEIQLFIKIQAEEQGLNLCPFFNKNFIFKGKKKKEENHNIIFTNDKNKDDKNNLINFFTFCFYILLIYLFIKLSS